MSQYPEAMSDLAWFRQQIEDLQSQLREVQRGPAVPQPVLQFGSRSARDAVVGKPLQMAWVSGDSAPGNNGPFQYFPGTGWKRPIGAETGSLVQMGAAGLPDRTLPFTGGTYNVSDYPDLAAYLGVGSGTFTLFNSGGRALIGTGTVADANNTIQTFTVGTKGGELTHTLSVAELAYHEPSIVTNAYAPSVFSSTPSSPTAPAQGTEGIVLNAYWAYSGSQVARKIIGTGGNQPHSVMQPYGAFPIAIRF